MAMIASFLLSILDRLTIPWRAQEYAPEASVAINLRLQSSLLQHPPAITLFLLRSVLRPWVQTPLNSITNILAPPNLQKIFIFFYTQRAAHHAIEALLNHHTLTG